MNAKKEERVSVRLKDGEIDDVVLLKSRLGVSTDAALLKALMNAALKMEPIVLRDMAFEGDGFERLPTLYAPMETKDRFVPVVGHIPAGPMEEAFFLSRTTRMINVKGFKAPRRAFALEISGESMTNRSWEGGGIRDGYFVILGRDTPEICDYQGKIVAMVKNDGTHTLKRTFLDREQQNAVRLVPLNQEFGDSTIALDEIGAAYPVYDVIPGDLAQLSTAPETALWKSSE